MFNFPIRYLYPFNPSEQLAFYFSLQYHPKIKCKGHENKGHYHQFKKLLTATQILLVFNMTVNVKRNMVNMNNDRV